MKTAEAVQQLKSTFASPIVSEIEFRGEITIEVVKSNLKQILAFLKNENGPGFEVLMDLTGVDYLGPVNRTKIVYWLHNPKNYERIRVIMYVAREEPIPSVTDIWEGADWYERELYDLFGIQFEGHPDMKRILMPDDWVGHPLRRDYALTEEPVAFKNDVKPKIPSEIIPYVKDTNRF